MELNINSSIVIATTSTVVSVERGNNNGRRALVTLVNIGSEDGFLSVDAEAKVNIGIPISPGGAWVDSRDGGYWPTQKQLNAISANGLATFAIQERVVD